MLAKRIIPCLDVTRGRVVKGTNFVDLVDTGDPVEMAKTYNSAGADELVFLDITATSDARRTTIELVKQVSKEIFIPFTVGGGIRSTEDMRLILRAGADKIAVNSAAVNSPKLVRDAAFQFGRQCVVVAIDAKRVGDHWEVYISGGRTPAGVDAVNWAKKVENFGAGELLITSIDRDGTKSGFDLELLEAISNEVNIPIIASGGAGSVDDFIKLFETETADAALAASVFHYNQIGINQLKARLRHEGIEVRLC